MLQSPHSAGGNAPDAGQAQTRRTAPNSLKLEQSVVTSHRRRSALARREREKAQARLFDDNQILHDQILQKLRTEDRIDPITGEWFAPTTQLANFARCGVDHVYKHCVGCDETTSCAYHCMTKWCPNCNWRITERRRELLKQWLPTIEQPKHIVTTQRNTANLTRKMIREHTKNLAKLRRSDVFDQVKGGCVSVELTNESRGWHLHAHWLVDARWVDSGDLARTWGKLVGQDFAIVKVIDARAHARERAGGHYALARPDAPERARVKEKIGGYEKELMKYCVKGNELAKWPQNEILQFVTAVRGQRFFFAFGQLFKDARKLRAQALADKPPTTPCECGSCSFIFTTDESRRRKKLKATRNR